MLYKELNAEKLTLVSENETDGTVILNAVLSSFLGIAFVVDNDMRIKGYIDVQSCLNADKPADLKNCIRRDVITIKQDSNIADSAAKIFTLNIYLPAVAIVNSSNQITGAVIFDDTQWLDMSSAFMEKLLCLEENGLFDETVQYCGFRKVAVFGMGNGANILSTLLFRNTFIEKCDVYEIGQRKDVIKENILDYEADVIYTDSFYSVLKKNEYDTVIFLDWRWRNAEKIVRMVSPETKTYNIVALSSLLEKAGNERLFMQLKQEFSAQGVNFARLSVPSAEKLGVKADTSYTHVMSWIQKELDCTINDAVGFNTERTEMNKNIIEVNEGVCLRDYSGKYINIVAHCRFVPNNNGSEKNRIFIVGPCIAMSQFSDDKSTIGYFLQQKINEDGLSYGVYPLALPNDAPRVKYYNVLRCMTPQSGDIVIHIDDNSKYINCEFDLFELFKKRYEEYGESLFSDFPMHCGKRMNREIAGFIYALIKEDKFSKEKSSDSRNVYVNVKKALYKGNPQLDKYKEYLRENMSHKRTEFAAAVISNKSFEPEELNELLSRAARQVSAVFIFAADAEIKEKAENAIKESGCENVLVYEALCVNGINILTQSELAVKLCLEPLNISKLFVRNSLIDHAYEQCIKKIGEEAGVEIVNL